MAFLDETGLAELWSLIRSEDAEAVADKAKIATGSYAGTNVCGSGNPNSLTFDFVPKIIIIFGGQGRDGGFINCRGLASGYRGDCLFYQYLQNPQSDGYAKLEGTTVSWYSSSTSYQFNVEPRYNTDVCKYTYVAIG